MNSQTRHPDNISFPLFGTPNAPATPEPRRISSPNAPPSGRLSLAESTSRLSIRSSGTSPSHQPTRNLPAEFGRSWNSSVLNEAGAAQPNPFAYLSSTSMDVPNNRITSGEGFVFDPGFASYRSSVEAPQQPWTRSNNSTPLTTPSPTPERSSHALNFRRRSQSQLSVANNLGGLDLNTTPNSRRSVSTGASPFNFAPRSVQPERYRYSAEENERLPVDLPYYEPGFQNTLKSGIEMAEKLTSVLHKSEVAITSDARFQNILKTAEELSRFSPQAERKVAVVGNTGGGKSSLINALLDEEDLAKGGGDGQAVTSYVTEYRYNRGSGRAFEIDYLQDSELDEELVQLLNDYRRPYAPRTSSDDRVAPEEDADMYRKSDSAKRFFSDAFGSHDDWNADLLKVFGPGSYEEALACVRTWARRIEWPNDIHNGRFTAHVEDSEQLKELIKTRIPDSIRPYMKIVRVYLKAQILETGLVLADLPGLGDINYARVQTAQRYISKCDQIFIVSGISRVVDDKNVFDILREHAHAFNLRGRAVNFSACIICTRAAELNKDDMKRRKNTVNPTELRRAEEQLQAANRGGGLVDERLKKEAKMNRLSLFVKARNSEIEAKLKATHEGADVSITVFFTDIKHYSDPINDKAVEISGIPRLREFCYRIRASALHAAATNFLNASLGGLVRSLELWCEASTQAGSQILQHQVDTADMRQKIEDIKDEWEESMLQFQTEAISRTFRTHQGQIKTEGLAACNSWNRLHAQSYLAWCRNYGTHKTGIGWMCWNSELIKGMTDVMTNKWEELIDKATSGCDSWKEIMNSIRELHNRLRAANASSALKRLMITRKKLIRGIIQEHCDIYLDKLGYLYREATCGHSTSFIVRQMGPIYELCAADNGSGVTQRCKTRIRNHVEHGNVYSNIHRQIISDLNTLVHETASELASNIEHVREQIDEDLTSVEVADDSLRDRDPVLFEELGRVLPEASRFVDGLRLNG